MPKNYKTSEGTAKNINDPSLLCDCHLHTSFSDDSDADPRVMISQALSMGLTSVCFTDHNDFDYPPENGQTLFNIDLTEYIDAVKTLQKEYEDRIEIFIGIEQGLMKSAADRINSYDEKHELDFIIGSSHLVNGNDPYYPEYWNDTGIYSGVLAYYESIMENLDTCTNFDVYGHLDYIARYIPADRIKEYNESDYREMIDAILRSVISHGKGIEINTSGYKYGLNAPNPSGFILKRYKELGGEIITVGSDAHAPCHIAFAFDRVPGILKNAGFRYYTRFRQRTPEFIRL